MTSVFDDEELQLSLAPAPPRNPVPTPRRSSQAAQQAASRVTSKLPPDRRTTQRIGLYDVKKTLGEGSFGKVKLATHQVTGQHVALKIISRKKLISRDMAGRVEREIQYLQLLRHPHIIKLYTVITTPQEIIMVLEYAGGELFDYLVKHGRMAEAKARRFFQQIVCAVEYCHRHKIVHRDLKPENLLLDNDLNVKIADFGLSNIMTDGNFLKTSCGSPNYAAPEVISGKLYAGPEVDVWSCGVILYVLLVGRLPFDDDFIPNLFKKINSGNYSTPPWMSSGARNLLHKMLKVNPVQRITVQEIRQDAWFNEGLEDYLRQPVEEFTETIVDPNKAIDPRQLAPGRPAAVQEQIHESVIGKLGKTMGYAKDDVQDALGKNEPNAIKDAYLIVRENQIMQTNPNIAKDVNPFLAASPPAWTPNMPPTPQSMTASNAERSHAGSSATTTPEPAARSSARSSSRRRVSKTSEPSPRTQATTPDMASMTPSRKSSVPTTSAIPLVREASEETPSVYVSKIAVLTSSLPVYHNAFMEARRKDARRLGLQEQGEPLNASEERLVSSHSLLEPGTQSSEQQAETMRHLKPHSRSTIQLQNITNQPMPRESSHQSGTTTTTGPDGRPVVRSGHRRIKWQFGIRSKNEPVDAIKCLYKALMAMEDCQWQIMPRHHRNSQVGGEDGIEGPFPVTVQGATHIPSAKHNLSESPEKDRQLHRDAHRGREGLASPSQGPTPSATTSQMQAQDFAPHPHDKFRSLGVNRAESQEDEERDEDVNPEQVPENYVPRDPWCIKIRWEKKGMTPPWSSATSTSVPSSLVDVRTNTSSALLASGQTSQSAMTGMESPHHPSQHDQARQSSETGARRGSHIASSSSHTLSSNKSAASSMNMSVTSPTVPESTVASGGQGSVDSGPTPDTACFVYLDLQLYIVDAEVYLVDFKSAGYEPIIGERKITDPIDGSVRSESIGSGQRHIDKDVSSPQPFLDLANRLVIHLARGA